MHQMRVDRYVKFNRDVWRVECSQCGMAVDDLGINEAAQVAQVLARRMCGSVVGGSADRAVRGDVQGLPLSDKQIIAMWSGRELSEGRVDAGTGAAS